MESVFVCKFICSHEAVTMQVASWCALLSSFLVLRFSSGMCCRVSLGPQSASELFWCLCSCGDLTFLIIDYTNMCCQKGPTNITLLSTLYLYIIILYFTFWVWLRVLYVLSLQPLSNSLLGFFIKCMVNQKWSVNPCAVSDDLHYTKYQKLSIVVAKHVTTSVLYTMR